MRTNQLSSLDIKRKNHPSTDPKKSIRSPNAQETGIVSYTNPRKGDSSYMNAQRFSPQKSQEGQTYSRKKRPIYVHSEDGKDKRIEPLQVKQGRQGKQGMRDTKSYPTLLEPEKHSSDDDEKEFGVINVSKITPSPRKKKRLSIYDEIEGLLDLNDDDGDDGDSKQIERKKLKVSTTSDGRIDLIRSFEEAKYGTKQDIAKKHKLKGIPKPITSRSELLQRARAHFEEMKLVLEGKCPPSIYYERAKRIRKNSSHETMTAKEQTRVDWELFYGGYYGFQRQSIIGKEITKVCQNELQKQRKNPTISYWSIPSFATHVLANEVIIQMIMEDLKLDYDAAEAVCTETTDYGIAIADKIEIEDDY